MAPRAVMSMHESTATSLSFLAPNRSAIAPEAIITAGTLDWRALCVFLTDSRFFPELRGPHQLRFQQLSELLLEVKVLFEVFVAHQKIACVLDQRLGSEEIDAVEASDSVSQPTLSSSFHSIDLCF